MFTIPQSSTFLWVVWKSHSQSWMVYIYIYIYIIVLTTLYVISMDFPYVKPPEALKKVCCVSGIGVQGVPGVQAPCSAAGMY